MCCAVVTGMSGVSYQPRPLNPASWKFSCSRTVPALAAETVATDVPLCPSLVAVIVAVPAATPVTRPPLVTVAMPALLLVHVTVRPIRALPLASVGVADSCCTPPMLSARFAGVTLSAATGAVDAVVVPVATFESSPTTAFTSRAPRYGNASHLYVPPATRARTGHVRFAPIAFPPSGVAQVPRVTLGVPPHVRPVPGP